MWPFPKGDPLPKDPLTLALLEQNRLLIELLRQQGTVLPRRSLPNSGWTKRTESDVVTVSRSRRVEIQESGKTALPEYMKEPKRPPASDLPSSGKAVTGGFSATISDSGPTEPPKTPPPSPSSTGPK